MRPWQTRARWVWVLAISAVRCNQTASLLPALHAQGCVSHARSAPFTTSARLENTAGAHVLALPDLHAHHAGHRLHAQLLHRLAALLLAARLLAAGAALLACGGQPGQSMGMVGQAGGEWPVSLTLRRS